MNFSPAWLILSTLALALIGACFTRQPMNAKIRARAPGAFIRVTDGLIHYQWHGPLEGPIIVLVHGLTTPSFIWRDQIPALVRAGYRVLTFDHFGRGYSDRPSKRQDLEFFISELDEIMKTLQVRKSYHLLGYSMGGGVVTKFTSLKRDQIRKLVLIAPIGFLEGQPNWMARWPLAGNLAMFVFGGWIMHRGAKKAALAEGVDSKMVALQLRETKYAGYFSAVLSSIRHTIYTDMRDAHLIFKERNVSILAIFGEEDSVIPQNTAKLLSEVNNTAQIVKIKGAGHGLVTTHSRQINEAILRFLHE